MFVVFEDNVRISRFIMERNFGQIKCTSRVHYMKEQNGAPMMGRKDLVGLTFGEISLDLLHMDIMLNKLVVVAAKIVAAFLVAGGG